MPAAVSTHRLLRHGLAPRPPDRTGTPDHAARRRLGRDPQADGVRRYHAALSRAVDEAGLVEGLLVAQTRHTTTGLMINEHEPLLLADLEALFERLAPVDGGLRPRRLYPPHRQRHAGRTAKWPCTLSRGAAEDLGVRAGHRRPAEPRPLAARVSGGFRRRAASRSVADTDGSTWTNRECYSPPTFMTSVTVCCLRQADRWRCAPAPIRCTAHPWPQGARW